MMLQPTHSTSGIHNSPIYLAPFIGREEAVGSVSRLLTDATTRLVTLVGPGGAGKTRLALHTAARVLRRFEDGAWLVDLSALCDADLVPQAIASALGLRAQPDRLLLETLASHLEAKHLLLILDNCEHLLHACREAAGPLLAASPRLRILATSREHLHLPFEVVWPVPPLLQPDPDHLPALGQLAAVEAVALFVDRAQRTLPAFALTEHNARDVAEICCRLDGLPLAIELCAARVRMLSAAQIAERLGDRFHLLTGGGPAVPARHQTLKAALDWSHDLLSPAEQVLFRRLAVFAGGYDLKAAEGVCPGDGLEKAGILDLLSQLESKSLLIVERRENLGRRYRLLETVQEYALDKLRTSGEQARVADRHLSWYLALAEQAEPASLWGAVDRILLDRMELERDNWRVALQWSLVTGRREVGLRLAAALAWYWYLRAYLHEGRRWLAQVLAAGKRTPPALRAKALSRAGALAVLQGDYGQGAVLHRRALALARRERTPLAAWSLQGSGLVALYSGDYSCAAQFFEESLLRFWETSHQAGVATVLLYQGLTACFQEKDRRASMLLEASYLLLQDLGDSVAASLARYGLSQLARRQGDLLLARELMEEAWRLAWEKGARLETALCLEGMAGLACAANVWPTAASLFGTAEALRQEIGAELPPGFRASRDRDAAAVRDHLDPQSLAAAWAAGRAMKPELAVAQALTGLVGAGRTASGPQAPLEERQLTPLQAAKRQYGGLTARERQVAALIAQGKTNNIIADELVTTVRTVEAHVTHILDKLGFSSRTQVATWAVAKGLAAAPRAWHDRRSD